MPTHDPVATSPALVLNRRLAAVGQQGPAVALVEAQLDPSEKKGSMVKPAPMAMRRRRRARVGIAVDFVQRAADARGWPSCGSAVRAGRNLGAPADLAVGRQTAPWTAASMPVHERPRPSRQIADLLGHRRQAGAAPVSASTRPGLRRRCRCGRRSPSRRSTSWHAVGDLRKDADAGCAREAVGQPGAGASRAPVRPADLVQLPRGHARRPSALPHGRQGPRHQPPDAPQPERRRGLALGLKAGIRAARRGAPRTGWRAHRRPGIDAEPEK